MALANRYTGKDLYLAWIWSGGTVTLNGDYREFGHKADTDLVEAQAGAEGAKAYLATLSDATFSYSGLETGTAGTAVLAATKEKTYGTLLWGPLGTTTGLPKFSCAAFAKGQETPHKYNDVAMLNIEFQRSGDWILHGSTATW